MKTIDKAETARMSEAELYQNEMKLKISRDYKNTIDTAFDEGKLEGKMEGIIEGKLEARLEGRVEGEHQVKLEIARKMKHKGFSENEIAEMTGLSASDILLL